MKAEISTQIVKINFKYIVDNALDREFWKKKWKIFEYDNVVMVLELYEINVRRNNIKLLIKGTHNVLEDYDYEVVSIPMGELNVNTLRNQVLRHAHSLVEYFEREFAERSDGYAVAENEQAEKALEHKNDLIAYLDEEGVTDEGIRDAYINQKRKSFYEITDNYINTFINKHLKHVHNMVDIMIEVEGAE